MIKRLIVKSNEWYDNLSETKRTAFFVFVILGAYIGLMFLMHQYKAVYPFLIWSVTFFTWRFSYTLIKWFEWYKENKS